jgi:Protein of unknown function (DUF1203)
MTITTSVEFQVHALPADMLDRVRETGVDISGNPIVHLVAGGGEPFRCCLRNAVAGEEAILFGYAPPIPAGSPYREVGPVYAHAQSCEGAAGVGYPSDWRGRPQVLRAYDDRGWIHDATRVYDGDDPEGVIADMFSEPGVAQIHSRNIAWGCYMFAITRP